MRLTEGMRTKIRQAFIEAIFNPKFEAIKIEERKIGDDVFNFIVAETDLKRWTSAPQGDFAEVSAIRAQFSQGHYTYVYFSTPKKIGHCLNNKSTVLVENNDLKLRHESWQLRQQKLEEDKKELSRKITAALNSVNTDKQLIDVWPECAPYIPASMVNLPAVVVTDIRNEINNALLGDEEK